MVEIVYHGADCCGARHIHNFRDRDEENVNGLIRALNERNYAGHLGFDGAPEVPANGNLLLEVILSNRQTQQYPRLMAELARLGFVYDASWVGQHGTPVHRFSRARKRLRLADNEFRWAGMMMGPNVGGDLPVFREGGRGQNPVYEVGDVVVCTNQNSRFYELRGEVTHINQLRNGVRDGIIVHLDTGGDTAVMSPVSWEPVVQAAPAAANVEYRHPRGLAPQPAPAPAPRRMVLTEVYARFRDGRIRGPFEDVDAMRAAYPRVRAYNRRIFYNNGEFETVPHTLER